MSGSPLQRLAAALVSRPFVYHLVQNLAGQGRVAERLLRWLPVEARDGPVLDVGSAEGGFSARLPVDPFCVDLDWAPLAALRRERRSARAAAADAAALPFPTKSFAVALCVAVSHHLDDRQLDAVLAELARVTRGQLVFLDAVRNERRALSRWLWRFDRGRHPRTPPELEAALERRFRLTASDAFTVRHQYVIWIAAPR